ncbi:hypothetical protein Tco_1393328 [Tanacetum coccineum]
MVMIYSRYYWTQPAAPWSLQFNVGTARQACLNAEVRMQTKFCLSERTRLEVECGRQANLLNEKNTFNDKVMELQSSLSAKDLEAKELAATAAIAKSQNDSLVDQWKSRIMRYIDTKPNSELIHYCLQNPPYTYQWTEKTVLVAECSFETTTKRYMENYKNVSQDIRDQLNGEAEAIQIILTGIDNDI